MWQARAPLLAVRSSESGTRRLPFWHPLAHCLGSMALYMARSAFPRRSPRLPLWQAFASSGTSRLSFWLSPALFLALPAPFLAPLGSLSGSLSASLGSLSGTPRLSFWHPSAPFLATRGSRGSLSGSHGSLCGSHRLLSGSPWLSVVSIGSLWLALALHRAPIALCALHWLSI